MSSQGSMSHACRIAILTNISSQMSVLRSVRVETAQDSLRSSPAVSGKENHSATFARLGVFSGVMKGFAEIGLKNSLSLSLALALSLWNLLTGHVDFPEPFFAHDAQPSDAASLRLEISSSFSQLLLPILLLLLLLPSLFGLVAASSSRS